MCMLVLQLYIVDVLPGLVVLAQKRHSGCNWAATEIMLMDLGLRDTVIVSCIVQHPHYNPGVAETPGVVGTMKVRKKGYHLLDGKAYAESGLSTSDLSWTEQLAIGTWKEAAEPV